MKKGKGDGGRRMSPDWLIWEGVQKTGWRTLIVGVPPEVFSPKLISDPQTAHTVDET